jgi:hypothetical protein
VVRQALTDVAKALVGLAVAVTVLQAPETQQILRALSLEVGVVTLAESADQERACVLSGNTHENSCDKHMKPSSMADRGCGGGCEGMHGGR